jgi:hypothetical protein
LYFNFKSIKPSDEWMNEWMKFWYQLSHLESASWS